MENVRRYKDTKLVATKRRKKLLSYYKVFQMKYISNRNEKKKKRKKKIMNQRVYLGLFVLDLSKSEFWKITIFSMIK